jgi:branched-chain amino acid transport system permease protein
VGSLFGPLLGAAVFLSLEELVWRKFLDVHTGVLGLLIVLLVMFLPKGLLSLSQRLPWARKRP